MIDIFTLVNPISSATEILLTHIQRICTAQKIPFFIAGATAREILLHHIHGRSPGRRTRDIDIAVFVDSWPMFDSLKKAFIAEGAQAVHGNSHRLIVEGTELDIIPFGGVAESNQIAWPPEREIIMSVDGFSEVFSHVINVQLNNGEKLPFCSIPGLALLKLFAWRDRGHASSRDATDLYKIIREYNTIENERIYASDEGEKVDWDPVRMGAILLGNDILGIIDRSSLAELRALDIERLTDAIVRQSDTNDFAEVEQVIDDFWNCIISSSETLEM